MKDICVKYSNENIDIELKSISFDSSYINVAKNKYSAESYKVFNLKPYEANILKQICLSLGFDCAVSRDTITCNCEYTNALFLATKSQIQKLIKKLSIQPFRLKKLSSELKNIIDNSMETLCIREFEFDWSRSYIMGILNVTPDSFSDGGKYFDTNFAVNKALELISFGADIIDIGGESTRPNANILDVDTEISRVIPVIESIREKNKNIVISVDTRNYETAKNAIEAGADIINDVSGLSYDKKLYEYVVQNNIPVIIMHSDKVPADSQDFTNNDIVESVYLSLKNKIDLLVSEGLDRKNIIIDVGIGFGKSVDSNFELLKRLQEFTSLKAPILLGISRKSFIRNSFDLSIDESDFPTALYSSMLPCVNIHRVHNVQMVKRYLDFTSKLF